MLAERCDDRLRCEQHLVDIRTGDSRRLPVFVERATGVLVSPGPPEDSGAGPSDTSPPEASRALIANDTGVRMVDLDAERLVASFPGHDLSTALNTPDGRFALIADGRGDVAAVDWADSFRTRIGLPAEEVAAVVER